MKNSMLSLGWAYRLVAAIFHEQPTHAFIATLATANLMAEWPLSDAREETQAGVRLMRAFCDGWVESLLPELEADFNRLFVGPGLPLAPPWESYYLNRDHLLFQEQTLAVRESYRRFGLEAAHATSEPDDSLSLELSFMAELCAKRSAAGDDGSEGTQAEILEAQRQFLATHLSRWAPQCLRLVIERARLDYYRAAALLGLGCLIEMGAALDLDLVGSADL